MCIYKTHVNIVTLLSVIKMPIDGIRDLSSKLLLYIQVLYSTIALYRERVGMAQKTAPKTSLIFPK